MKYKLNVQSDETKFKFKLITIVVILVFHYK